MKGGEFEEREIEQYYDEEYDQFLADRYIVGTCPNEEEPSATSARTAVLTSPLELIHPRSPSAAKRPN